MSLLELFRSANCHADSRLLLCYGGLLPSPLLEALGRVLRDRLLQASLPAAAVMDVFGIYIELTQNARHYFQQESWAEQEQFIAIMISAQPAGMYRVAVGNPVAAADGALLVKRLAELAALDRAQLKQRYKTQLRQAPSAAGAGLGLLEVARKANGPLLTDLQPLADGKAFLSLQAEIGAPESHHV